MRIFKYKNFAKWAKSEKISDVTLLEAASEEEKEVYLVLAKYLLTLTDKEINEWLRKQKLVEVNYES